MDPLGDSVPRGLVDSLGGSLARGLVESLADSLLLGLTDSLAESLSSGLKDSLAEALTVGLEDSLARSLAKTGLDGKASKSDWDYSSKKEGQDAQDDPKHFHFQRDPLNNVNSEVRLAKIQQILSQLSNLNTEK